MFLGLVLLISNHMFSSDDFADKSPLSFLKILKLPSLYLGNFKVFKNVLGQFILNGPPKNVITSTDCNAFYNSLKHLSKHKKSLTIYFIFCSIFQIRFVQKFIKLIKAKQNVCTKCK